MTPIGYSDHPANQPEAEDELLHLGEMIQAMEQLDRGPRERALLYLCDRYIAPDRQVAFRDALRRDRLG